jgi:hypothetical protein
MDESELFKPSAHHETTIVSDAKPGVTALSVQPRPETVAETVSVAACAQLDTAGASAVSSHSRARVSSRCGRQGFGRMR